MGTIEWHEIVGWLGMALLLTAYSLNSLEKMKASYVYQALNIFGALGVAISAFMKGAYPATALEVVWLLIAALAIVRLYFRKPEP